jgi:cytochrome c556
MKSFVTAACLATLFLATAASADPIEDRQKLMKGIGDATKVSAEMVQGKTAWDAAAAKGAMATITANAKLFPTLFPAGTETGGDTEAAPKIWQDKAGFDAIAAKLASAAEAAESAADGGLDAFKPAFGAMAANCKACHQDYRIQKN